MSQCTKCSNPALPDREHCSVHDHETAVARGRKGGFARSEKYRAQRAEQAAAISLDTIAQIRETLELATKEAYADGDWSCVVSACRAATDLLFKVDMEQEVRKMRELFNAHIKPGGKTLQ